MRILTACALIVLITALSCEPGFAASANKDDDILQGCRDVIDGRNSSSSSTFLQGYCYGAVNGLIFLMSIKTCFPKGVTTAGITRVIVQYIDQLPASEKHEMGFMWLAAEAMRKTWPPMSESCLQEMRK